jgi:ACR3 family arsenite efflux pump ArsB
MGRHPFFAIFSTGCIKKSFTNVRFTLSAVIINFVFTPLSLAIAVVTFPEQPLISLALVIGPLIELPVLSVISGILKRWNDN